MLRRRIYCGARYVAVFRVPQRLETEIGKSLNNELIIVSLWKKNPACVSIYYRILKEKSMRKFFQTRYFKVGAAVFMTGALLIMFYQVVTHWDGFRQGASALYMIFSPFIYGMVAAYLLCPIYNFVVRKLYPHLSKKLKPKTSLRVARVFASIAAFVVLVAFIVALILMIVSQVIQSLVEIVQTLPQRINYINNLISDLLANMSNRDLATKIGSFLDDKQRDLIDWAANTLPTQSGKYISMITQQVIITVKTVFNMLLGMIACFYFLNGKEKFKAEIRKTIIAVFSHRHANEIFDFAAYSNRTFGGFINGKIIDSLIIGVICFVAMSILRMPYTILISTIVGLTNVIPFFGPFIGAIPSTVVIVLVDPVKALIFLVLIFLLQQFDGNILGPAVMGSKVGLASFWVMFAIIVGGGLFGFIGMVLGVPTFAIIYYYFSKCIRKKLSDKQIAPDTKDHIEFNRYDIDRRDVL